MGSTLTAWRVSRLFDGQTVVCIAGGPSLTRADVETCAHLPTVGVNDAYRIARLDVLYGCDPEWWDFHSGVPEFEGIKATLSDPAARKYGLRWLRNSGMHGFDPDPTALRTGQNGGYQALHLAVHLGAARVILLGYDMCAVDGRRHWFGDHPGALNKDSPYGAFLQAFDTITGPLRERGIEVMNCTPDSALTAFPQVTLAKALACAGQREVAHG